MMYRMMWPSSLSRDRKWPRVNNRTHSRVAGLRLAGSLVYKSTVWVARAAPGQSFSQVIIVPPRTVDCTVCHQHINVRVGYVNVMRVFTFGCIPHPSRRFTGVELLASISSDCLHTVGQCAILLRSEDILLLHRPMSWLCTDILTLTLINIRDACISLTVNTVVSPQRVYFTVNF